MVSEGHQVAHLSGALEGKDRDVIIDRFRTGEAKVLITTNVLARGIDVQTVSMVINYVREIAFCFLLPFSVLQLSPQSLSILALFARSPLLSLSS